MRYTSVWKALKLTTSKHRILSVTGAGGKTSLVWKLCREAVEQGKSVIVTTTTHMAFEPERPFIELVGDVSSVESRIAEQLKKTSYVLAAAVDHEKNKLKSAEEWDRDFVRKLSKWADIVLIEADGARYLPVKAPGRVEPQIFEDSDAVVGVIGLGCLGKPISDAAFRPESLAQFLHKKTEDLLTEKDLQTIMESRELLKKNVKNKPYRVLLNQSDRLTEEQTNNIVKILNKTEVIAAVGSCHQNEYTGKGRILKLVLMASGYSRRFGSNKLLHEIRGKSMFQTAVDQLSYAAEKIQESADCWRSVQLVVVTQYREIEEFCREKNLDCIKNFHPERGISESMKLGLKSSANADATLFMTADMPYLRGETLQEFLEEFYESGKSIGCLCNEGIPISPCIFSDAYDEELLQISGDRGGKSVLKAHMDEVYMKEAPPGELSDIDDPEMVR